MVVIIQCAATKQAYAGYIRDREGRKVCFVAQPDLAPRDGTRWARPDDLADAPSLTWRGQVERVNATQSNPFNLLEAWRLYMHPVYARLVRSFGVSNVRILSAGWGLVRADYLLPAYDITFSAQADAFKRRRKGDRYADFAHIDSNLRGPLVFVGGKDYLPLFEYLTRNSLLEKVVFRRCDPADVNASDEHRGDLVFRPFRTSAKTNWHYACAEMLCDKGSELMRSPA